MQSKLNEIAEYTERLNTLEKEMVEINEKLLFIAGNMSDALWLIDVETMIVEYVSPSVQDILGYHPGDFIGQKTQGLTQDNLKILINDAATTENHVVKNLSLNIPHKETGLIRNLSFSLKFYYEDDVAKKVIGVARDITEHKYIENELRKSQERFKALADLTSEGIGVTGPDLILRDANSHFVNIFEDYSLEELNGKHLSSLGISEIGCKLILDAIFNQDQRAFEIEYCNPSDSQQYKLLSVRTKMAQYMGEEYIAVVFFRDVSFERQYPKRVDRRGESREPMLNEKEVN